MPGCEHGLRVIYCCQPTNQAQLEQGSAITMLENEKGMRVNPNRSDSVAAAC